MRGGLLAALVLVAMCAPAAAQPATTRIISRRPVHQHDEAQPEPAAVDLPPFIPPLTDADRAAAFPDVHGHAMRDNAVNYFVLFDQLEWEIGSGADAFAWDTKGWVGRDLDRFWFRTEGTAAKMASPKATRICSMGARSRGGGMPWAGSGRTSIPGAPQTWAAIGVQGLAPYWFDVEATAYVGGSGRTEFRVETEYSFLLTNRLILQPLVELSVFGKDDPEREVGRGISTLNAGLRLRYEFRRELAPYVGVTWDRSFFGTADYQEAAGKPVGRTRLVVGLRIWM